MKRARVGLLAGTVTLLVGMGVSPALAGAQDAPVSGPSVTLDRYSVRPGEKVLVTLTGFTSNVTLTVCGNQGRRGSMDCNMVASEGVSLHRDGSPTFSNFPVAAPATTCPCLISASTKTFDQIAVAPIEIIGHPVGPVVGIAKTSPVDISVSAERASSGVVAGLRSWIGGPTSYDVTVTVRNRSTERLDNIVLAGAARRSGDGRDVNELRLPKPGPLDPGQTWTEVVRAEVPAPVIGRFVWSVSAVAGGNTAEADTRVRLVPFGFLLLIATLVGLITAIVMRRLAKRRDARSDEDGDDVDDTFVGLPGGGVPVGVL